MLIVAGGIYLGSGKIRPPQPVVSIQTTNKTTKPLAGSSQDLSLPILKNDSRITWKAAKQMGNSHTGVVRFKSGHMTQTAGQISGGDFVIDMRTITVTDLPPVSGEQLVNHLMSQDFFEVETYPEAHLVITQVEPADKNQLKITADLTIKDQTHPITFVATKTQNQNRTTLKASFEIDRTQWGITYGSGKFFENLGDNLIKDNIEYLVSIVFESPLAKNTTLKPDNFVELRSRIEGAGINIEQASIEVFEYQPLSQRIEGAVLTNQPTIQLSTETEYRNLSSRIE